MSLRNKKKILAIIAPWLTISPIYKWLGKKWSGAGTILMFHRILPKSREFRVHNHESLEIDAEQLEATILFFKKRKYDFLSIDQLASYKSTADKKFVVFTFDDGYIDNLTHAYPILKKYQVPFTIYITTNFINRKAVIWWYLLEEILSTNDSISIVWKGKPLKYKCQKKEEKENVFNEIRDLIMQELDPACHLDVFRQIFSNYFDDLFRFTNENMLTWEQIGELAKDPLVTIASHTVNHLPLRLLSQQQLSDEITGSGKELKDRLGMEIKHFAYPFGKQREAFEREYSFIRECGFTSAVTTNIGNVSEVMKTEMVRLPRVNVNRYTTAAVLEMHISGFITFLKKLNLNL
ncbi:MAG: polysaccharide deacetylase family protein [Saprospiraceae bacterium]|nr:polysaccharide deacetylase family protein [Saprospiraceae bacterium]